MYLLGCEVFGSFGVAQFYFVVIVPMQLGTHPATSNHYFLRRFAAQIRNSDLV